MDAQENNRGVYPPARDNVGAWCTRCNKMNMIRHNIGGMDVELCPNCDGPVEGYQQNHVSDKLPFSNVAPLPDPGPVDPIQEPPPPAEEDLPEDALPIPEDNAGMEDQEPPSEGGPEGEF